MSTNVFEWKALKGVFIQQGQGSPCGTFSEYCINSRYFVDSFTSLASPIPILSICEPSYSTGQIAFNLEQGIIISTVPLNLKFQIFHQQQQTSSEQTSKFTAFLFVPTLYMLQENKTLLQCACCAKHNAKLYDVCC